VVLKNVCSVGKYVGSQEKERSAVSSRRRTVGGELTEVDVFPSSLGQS
jgi:hypothetical protein